MKIESSGFKITDICEDVLSIVVDSNGVGCIYFPGSQSPYLAADDLTTLRDALTVAIDRIQSDGVAQTPAGPATKLIDNAGDVWHLHRCGRYALAFCKGADCDCLKGPDCGYVFEELPGDWAPYTPITD